MPNLYLWIPHPHHTSRWRDFLQHNRLRPRVARVIFEHLPDNNGGSGFRVQLAHAGDNDSPRNAVKEADRLAIERTAFCPELDGTEAQAEGLLVGDQR